MRFYPLLVIIALLAFSLLEHPVDAAYKLVDGHLINVKDLATSSLEEHHAFAKQAFEEENWQRLLQESRILLKSFPQSEQAYEARYFTGVSYYHLGDYHNANKFLSRYLSVPGAPQYFSEALRLKFAIAEQFRQGVKKHLFNTASLPRWVSAKNDALEIYDELARALPGSEIAAKAMLGKADLYLQQREYSAAAGEYQAFLQRYPHHFLAPQSYVSLLRSYRLEGHSEYQNPDLLAHAYVQFRHFEESFPQDPKLEEGKKELQRLEEIYAQGYYDMGRLYERKKQPHASVLYYLSALRQFPQAEIAKVCRQRLQKLQHLVSEMNLTVETL